MMHIIQQILEEVKNQSGAGGRGNNIAIRGARQQHQNPLNVFFESVSCLVSFINGNIGICMSKISDSL